MEKRRARFVSTEALPRSMPLARATDITRTANLKLRFAGHFRVPWDDNGPDGARIRLAECGLTAITVSAGYIR